MKRPARETEKGRLVKGLIREMNESKTVISHYGLAKLLIRKYPLQFTDSKKTENVVRYYLGTQGEYGRKNANEIVPLLYRPSMLPKSHAESWEPHIIDTKVS